MNTKLQERFLQLYNDVYKNGKTISLCGKNLCLQLILCADEVEPDVRHGDTTHCRLYEKQIKALYHKLTKQKP